MALVAAVPVVDMKTDYVFPPLPDAIAEAEMVASRFHSAHLLTGRPATVAATHAQLSNATIFHFAGHAVGSSRRAGLLLSDGLLTAYSISAAELARMQLAVFSACGTQFGSTGRSDDPDSLVRTFLRAGVPHIVASRWNVDSAATRLFMDSFYKALLNGSSVAESIYQAQSQLRSRSGMAHPYYWSAFSVFGSA
jgi:CHAT domain-containing protein